MKKFFSDFKNFITKGNIVDLAVAVVVGGAFGKIVTSLVNDIIMPLITLIVGGASVADWKWIITPAVYDAAGVLVTAENALHYGNFLQTIIDFLIISFFIFLALKILMSAKMRVEKIENGIAVASKKEHRAHVKELRAQGLNKSQIKEKLREEELEAERAAKEEEQRVQAEKEANAPETTEKILQDIRELLSKERQVK